MNRKKAPPQVYMRKGRWVFCPYVNGKRLKEVPLRHEGKLIREDDPMSWVWIAWENHKLDKSDTIKWLINKYLRSPTFEQLKPRTKRSYRASADYLINKRLKNGKLFGHITYESVTPGVATKLYDSMMSEPVIAKHRMQFIRAVYSWGFARDICSSNPIRGAQATIKKKTSTKVYVEDVYYYHALEIARELKSYLYPMMILAYNCRARVGEISRREFVEGNYQDSGIKMSDINDEGIHIYRSKGSLPEVTLWSDFLREGYDAANAYSKAQDKKRKIHTLNPDPYLIRDRDGAPIKKNAFDSAWQRLMAKCSATMKDFKRFSVHELKAKGIDDHKNHASGHKSERAKLTYMRKTKRTESTR